MYVIHERMGGVTLLPRWSIVNPALAGFTTLLWPCSLIPLKECRIWGDPRLGSFPC